MKRVIKIYFALLFVNVGFAQDMHFSQFDVNVVTLNPAYTGVMRGDYRIANNYRNQWGTVSAPYTTFSVTGDVNVLDKKVNKGLSDIGIGLGFFSDKIGSSNLSQNQFNFSLSAIQQVNFDTKLSLGLQGAYNQQSISMNNLTWDTQFQGHKFQEDLPSQELFGNSKSNYLDINAGVLLQKESWDNTFTLGGAIYHANSPKQGIFTNEKLAPKFVTHFSYDIKLGRSNSKKRFIPKALYTRQRKHQEILLGGLLRQYITEASRYTQFANESYFEVGAYYRVLDAVVLVAGLDMRRIHFALSYDLNVSKFRTVSKMNGGFELSLAYKGIFSDNRIKLKK